MKPSNIVKAFICCVAFVACAGADLEDNGSDQEIGTAEQPITLAPSYGVRNVGVQAIDSGGRCFQPASGNCYVPRFKVIEVDLDTNGVPLNADRTMFGTEKTNAINSNNASGVKGGFTFMAFQQQGFCSTGHTCVRVKAQSSTPPVFNAAWTPATSIRRYIQCIPGDTVAMGEGTNLFTFGNMVCNVNFVGLKAFLGVGSGTNCPNSTACGVQQLMYHAVAQVAGNGWTTAPSGNNNGADFDVSATSFAISAGDICRRSQYNPTTPHVFFNLPDTCAL